MKWIASIHANDEPDAPVLRLGYEGTSDGFLIVDDDGGYPTDEPGYTVEDVRAIIEELFGYYDTFQWLDS